ncbi:hypothetical protein PsorP6_010285 [Peronosclerospora sorghi]|uniref:Uncharacterized protein n=1 Tax=Peronosclerospora sorghi TaxID=230839 RepID=A0ACC0VWG0_9STRA|nr:hypothetical protein PsorP6_010285 [Peronosclerospora sorghi]
MAEEIPNAYCPNQFDNVANMRAHYEGTGPEIWDQVEGQIHGFVTSAGTAGAVAGISTFLKEQNADIKVWLLDPKETAAMAVFINNKRSTSMMEDGFEMVPMAKGSTIAEGVEALAWVNLNLRKSIADQGITAKNQEIVDMAYFLMRNDGIFSKHRRQLNRCIERVEKDYSRGLIGLGDVKQNEAEAFEEGNLYSRSYTRPRTGNSSTTTTTAIDGYVGVMMPSKEKILAVGSHVAAKVAGSHELWIMARVVKFNAPSSTYEVEDVDSGDDDDDKDAPRRHYVVPWKQVVELPCDSLSEGEWIQYAVNERVMVMYPNTTSFFRSTIRVPNPRVSYLHSLICADWEANVAIHCCQQGAPYVVVKFDEDEDEHGLIPDRKVPFRFVAPLKPWHQK